MPTISASACSVHEAAIGGPTATVTFCATATAARCTADCWVMSSAASMRSSLDALCRSGSVMPIADEYHYTTHQMPEAMGHAGHEATEIRHTHICGRRAEKPCLC